MHNETSGSQRHFDMQDVSSFFDQIKHLKLQAFEEVNVVSVIFCVLICLCTAVVNVRDGRVVFHVKLLK